MSHAEERDVTLQLVSGRFYASAVSSKHRSRSESPERKVDQTELFDALNLCRISRVTQILTEKFCILLLYTTE